MDSSRSVLVVGVELVDRQSYAQELTRQFYDSSVWEVDQVWFPLGQPRVPKFVLLNHILQQQHLDRYDYILVCDDDIQLPENFLDRYLAIVEGCDFALAQPARTHRSDIHHPIVAHVPGLVARQTRFVEIGPLFSMRQDVVPLLLPFDESSPMGWGYEFVWPLQIEPRRMGIVDATPVSHTMRPAVSEYSGAGDQMIAYLLARPHLSREDAYTTVQEYLA